MVENQVPSSVGSMRPGLSTPSVDGSLPDAGIPAQYERLLVHLTRAEAELTAGDSVGRSRELEEASGIVFDLLYALDFRRGGELVPRLAALYGYIGNQLLNIGRTGDVSELAHVRDMVETLQRSWYAGEGL
jgi:flagellar biosynthetic protein FliS